MSYAEECHEIQQEAMRAGLKVRGPLHPDLGWRPGVLLDVSFTYPPAVAFAEERGYSIAPSNTDRRLAIIEKQ